MPNKVSKVIELLLFSSVLFSENQINAHGINEKSNDFEYDRFNLLIDRVNSQQQGRFLAQNHQFEDHQIVLQPIVAVIQPIPSQNLEPNFETLSDNFVKNYFEHQTDVSQKFDKDFNEKKHILSEDDKKKKKKGKGKPKKKKDDKKKKVKGKPKKKVQKKKVKKVAKPKPKKKRDPNEILKGGKFDTLERVEKCGEEDVCIVQLCKRGMCQVSRLYKVTGHQRSLGEKPDPNAARKRAVDRETIRRQEAEEAAREYARLKAIEAKKIAEAKKKADALKKKNKKKKSKAKKGKKVKKAKKGKKGKKSLGRHHKKHHALLHKKSRSIKPLRVLKKKIFRTKQSIEQEKEDLEHLRRQKSDPEFYKAIARRIVAHQKKRALEAREAADREYQRQLDIIVGDNAFAQKKSAKPEKTGKPEAKEVMPEAKKSKKKELAKPKAESKKVQAHVSAEREALQREFMRKERKMVVERERIVKEKLEKELSKVRKANREHEKAVKKQIKSIEKQYQNKIKRLRKKYAKKEARKLKAALKKVDKKYAKRIELQKQKRIAAQEAAKQARKDANAKREHIDEILKDKEHREYEDYMKETTERHAKDQEALRKTLAKQAQQEAIKKAEARIYEMGDF